MKTSSWAFALFLVPTLAPTGCGDSSTVINPCDDGETFVDGACRVIRDVRLNSVGYLPKRQKLATFSGDSGEFEVFPVDGDEAVFSGVATGPLDSPDTDETSLYVGDFTELEEEGRYYVVAGDRRSHPFEIGPSALDEALQAVMLGLYGQRCGEEVTLEFEEDEFSHGACHTAPATTPDGKEKDDRGGWHDAGDYGKYARNGAFAVAFLLAAHEHFEPFSSKLRLRIPEAGGDVPDLLDEARVELEWLLKVQFDDGSFSHKVTAKNFEGAVMPTNDTQPRFFVSASSHATGNSVAVLAQAARLFEPYDPDFATKSLEAAERGQEFLEQNPEEIQADQAGFSTGGYGSPGDEDERLWALVELWETTGDAEYLAAVETQLPEFNAPVNFDWPQTSALALSTYVRSQRDGRDPELVASVESSLLDAGRAIVAGAQTDLHGRGFDQYYWGTNGVLARMSYSLAAAHFVEPNAGYLDALTAQIDHLFGRNVYNRSYVSRLGGDPVLYPHHRPSAADSVSRAWPGLLIGGPHSEPFGSEGGSSVPEALTWSDEYENYLHNEVAINWNTALAYALVAAIATQNDTGGGCLVDCGAPGMGGMGGMGLGGGPG